MLNKQVSNLWVSLWEKTSFSAEKLDLSGLGERWIKITVVSHSSSFGMKILPLKKLSPTQVGVIDFFEKKQTTVV